MTAWVSAKRPDAWASLRCRCPGWNGARSALPGGPWRPRHNEAWNVKGGWRVCNRTNQPAESLSARDRPARELAAARRPPQTPPGMEGQGWQGRPAWPQGQPGAYPGYGYQQPQPMYTLEQLQQMYTPEQLQQMFTLGSFSRCNMRPTCSRLRPCPPCSSPLRSCLTGAKSAKKPSGKGGGQVVEGALALVVIGGAAWYFLSKIWWVPRCKAPLWWRRAPLGTSYTGDALIVRNETAYDEGGRAVYRLCRSGGQRGLSRRRDLLCLLHRLQHQGNDCPAGLPRRHPRTTSRRCSKAKPTLIRR